MTDFDNLYLAYKRHPKTRLKENTEKTEYKPVDEIDELYSLYRKNSVDDYQRQIDAVMEVSKEMVATEIAVESVIRKSNSFNNVSIEKVGGNKVINQIFNAPRLLLLKLKSAASFDKENWVSLALPVVAVAFVAAAIVGYLGRDNSLESGSDTLAQYSGDLTGYIDTVVENQYGFTGSISSDTRQFYLGVTSVDLKISQSAQFKEGMNNSLNRVASLLEGGENESIIANVSGLKDKISQSEVFNEAIETDTLNLLSEITVQAGASEGWFELGSNVQSVYLSAMLAIDEGVFDPLISSIDGLSQSFLKIDSGQFSEPELKALQSILSYDENKDYSLDELRSVRDSASDIKSLRLISGM